MYLRKGMDQLFEMYPRSFSNRSKILLKKLVNSENVINYNNLSFKINFSEENIIRFHEIDFLKKYGMLYDLLDTLLTSKITVDNANVDQITFMKDLMHGHDKNDSFDEKREMR